MKPANTPFAVKTVLCVSFLFLSFFLSASNASAASTIQGIVYDKQRNSLQDIDVELLNDYYQLLQRTRTDGSGRYQFNGLSDGRYTVRVLAFRYDFDDQEMPVEISTQGIKSGQGGVSITQGTGFFVQDFYLLPKKGGLKEAELSVVFAQEVPKEAKDAYEKAIDDFSKKRQDEGFNNLKKAIQIFPTYYLALYRFGVELFTRKQYMDSASAFMKAVEVNPKSATSLYYLGFAFHNLGKDYDKAALNVLSKASSLAPVSPQVLWLLGKIERSTGKYSEAEKHLLQAKKLSINKIPEIHKELAQLYANELKKFKEAADELELYMKASNLSGDEEKKVKKLISDLREKSKTQAGS
jgi:tetratricopeptide (TPR) repeat protein